jgi:HEAT repeat protein
LLKGSDAPIGDALAALAAIEDAKARTIVFDYLDDPNRELRAAAVNALGYMKSPLADTFLIQALRDPDHEILWTACEAVGRKGTPRAIPVLRELLRTRKDDTGWIESALRNCLGLKDDEPIPEG